VPCIIARRFAGSCDEHAVSRCPRVFIAISDHVAAVRGCRLPARRTRCSADCRARRAADHRASQTNQRASQTNQRASCLAGRGSLAFGRRGSEAGRVARGEPCRQPGCRGQSKSRRRRVPQASRASDADGRPEGLDQ